MINDTRLRHVNPGWSSVMSPQREPRVIVGLFATDETELATFVQLIHDEFPLVSKRAIASITRDEYSAVYGTDIFRTIPALLAPGIVEMVARAQSAAELDASIVHGNTAADDSWVAVDRDLWVCDTGGTYDGMIERLGDRFHVSAADGTHRGTYPTLADAIAAADGATLTAIYESQTGGSSGLAEVGGSEG